MCVCVRCEFHGTTTELSSHVEHCPYEAVSHYITRTESQFGELIKMLQHKDEEISFLRAMLGQLSGKVDSLQKTLEGSAHVFLVVLFSLV